jgi:NAD(P)-dependent dehydrogenase (short-subunit alcohol dehydrogenase family)
MQALRVLVTGASRGIGRAIALRFAREGAHVALCARSTEALEEVAREVEEAGGRSCIQTMDVTDPNSVELGVAAALDAFSGGLDVLVNNAGIFDLLPFEETTPAMWERFYRVNLHGVFLVTHCALPGLRRGARAHIFNIASGAAREGFEGCSIYCAMKAGLMGFSNGLREDLRPDGIRVATIYPGSTDTGIFDGVPGDWDRDSMNQPEDVADTLWSGLMSSGETSDLTVPPPGQEP